MTSSTLGDLTIIPDHAAEEMRKITSISRTTAMALAGRSAAPHAIRNARDSLLVIAERSLALYFETQGLDT